MVETFFKITAKRTLSFYLENITSDFSKLYVIFQNFENIS